VLFSFSSSPNMATTFFLNAALLPLFFLLLLGVFFLFSLIFHRRFRAESGLLGKMSTHIFQKKKWLWRLFFLFFAFFFLCFSLLRPQWGEKENRVEYAGIDLVFTLDVSRSMNALDLSTSRERIDRLAFAKEMIKNFVQKNPDNRYGLVLFAGEAFVSVPLTLDHNAFLTFLDGTSSRDVGEQGTDISESLAASVDRFSQKDEDRGRAIVLISDGGEDAPEDLPAFAHLAEKEGVTIFSIGIGSTEGAHIPEGQSVFGDVIWKTHEGKRVITKLNEAPLQELAHATNGQYFHATSASDLRYISEEISTLQKGVLTKKGKRGKEDRYQIFLLFSFLSFLSFLLYSEYRGRRASFFPSS